MAKLLKLRRGTTSQHSSFTGAEGEVTVDTTKDTLVVHDGSTAGGHPVAAQDMDNVPAGAILGTQLENSGVTAGQYGSSSAIPIVTVDAQGLVTAASTTAIDSTTIANGTSNVAVASNGNITTTRSGTARLVVDNEGVDVTGHITATSGNLITDYAVYLNSSNGTVFFGADTGGFGTLAGIGIAGNNNYHVTGSVQDDLVISAKGSKGIVFGTKTANSAGATTERAKIKADGTFDITGNLDVGAGLDVTGNITCTGTIDGRDVAGDGSKLDGIESGATADQTAAEILTAIKTVDGAGSGLDADTLDGISSASFVRSDSSDTLTGSTYTISSGTDQKIILSGSNSPYIRWQEGTTNKAYIQWHTQGFFDFVNQETGEYMRIGNGSSGLRFNHDGTDSTVWHSGNDGSSSGLDADQVDGLHASSFIRSDTDDDIAKDHQIRFYSDAAMDTSTAYLASLEVYSGNGAGTDAFMSFHVSGDHAVYFGLDGGTNDLAVGGWSKGANSYKIFHENNFGGSQVNALLNSENITCAGLDAGSGTIRTNGWYYNDDSGDGLYNSSTTQHFYSDHDDYWNVAGGSTANAIRFRDDHGAAIRGYCYADSSNQIGFLDEGGSWSLRTRRSNNECMLYDQHFLSDTNGQYDLGSSSYRWRNVYTSDLDLSNEAKGVNDIDGTWGHYTIVEGESDLFLKNNRSGKKYKFNLTEVN